MQELAEQLEGRMSVAQQKTDASTEWRGTDPDLGPAADAAMATAADAAMATAADAATTLDNEALGRFHQALRAKMARSRAKGRSGWNDPDLCSERFLAEQLVGHLAKGNPGTFEDIACFAMMLHQRGASPRVLARAARNLVENGRTDHRQSRPPHENCGGDLCIES